LSQSAAPGVARIILSRAAQRDLVEIGDYGEAQFGFAAADAYQDDIERCFDRLADYPLSGEAKEAWGPGLRHLPCNQHRIIYKVDGNTVQIVRVLHHARDVLRHLKP